MKNRGKIDYENKGLGKEGVSLKIGELDQHCGECNLIEYCAEPFDELCLCTDSRLKDVEEKKYKELADKSTKYKNYEKCKEVINLLKV